jgi:hypothetical protein
MKKIIRALFFLILGAYNFIVCEKSDFQNQLAQLSVEKTFDVFDLNLSPQDIEIVQSIMIDEANSFGKHETIALNHYGDLDGYLEKVAYFLKKFGNSEENSLAAAQVIYKIIDNCLTMSDSPEAWIAIRVFKKNKTYHEARWHIDESLYKTDCKYSYKLSCVLKGANTLLCDVSDETRKEFFKIQANKSQQRQYHTTKSVRSRLVDLLQGHTMHQAEFGQGIMFIMGDKTIGAIHSEPAIDESRIFISIVPGTHEQIQELYNRWHVIIQGRFK